MAYVGLETLFQNMGPTYAANIAGQREGTALGLDQLEAQKRQQDLLAQQQAYEQANVMNPLLTQERQGVISRQGAELPGLQATSRKLGVEAGTAEATQKSDILSKIAKGETEVSTEHLKKMTNLGQMAGQLGQTLSQLPEGMHIGAKQQFIKDNGIDPNSTIGKYVMEKSPQDFIKVANQVSQMLPAYIQAKAVADTAAASHIQGAQISAGAMLKGKQMEIEAGKFNKGNIEKLTIAFNKAPPATRLGMTKMALDSGINPFTHEALSDTDRTQFQSLYDQDVKVVNAANAVRAGQGIVGTVQPGGGIGLTTKTAPDVGGSSSPSPAKHSLADVQKMYPGIPPDKIKQAYKQKFGVDLQ